MSLVARCELGRGGRQLPYKKESDPCLTFKRLKGSVTYFIGFGLKRSTGEAFTVSFYGIEPKEVNVSV